MRMKMWDIDRLSCMYCDRLLGTMYKYLEAQNMKTIIVILTVLFTGVSFADEQEEKICAPNYEKKTIVCVGDKVKFHVHSKAYEGTVITVDLHSGLAGIRSTNWRDATIWQGYKKLEDISPEKLCYKDFCVGDRVLFEVHSKYKFGKIRSFSGNLAIINNKIWQGYKEIKEIFRAP